MIETRFTCPLWIDLLAVGVGALSGVTVAVKHRFDLIGALVMALVTGLGGALLRDGLFIQGAPPSITRSEWYVAVAVGTAVFTPLLLRMPRHLTRAADWMDTIALGLYGMIGTQAALAAGLAYGPAVCVGVVNAVGGGLMRDIICNEDSALFKPGTYYAAAVIAGSTLFVVLNTRCGWSYRDAGMAGFLLTVGARSLAVIFNIRTKPVAGH